MAPPRKDGMAPRKPRKVHLTDAFLKKQKAPDRRVIYWDKRLKGFCLQAEASGHRSWKFHYRIGGRPCWYHIADVRALPSAKAARDIVEKLNARRVLDETYDPHGTKLLVRASGTFESHLKKYLVFYHDVYPKSYVHTRWTLEHVYLGVWGKQKSQSIKQADVKRLFQSQSKTSKSSANQAVAHLQGFFRWLINDANPEDKIAGPNPCAGLRRNKLTKRGRVLDHDELKSFWAALDEINPVQARAFRVLILTGQRPGEVAKMRREHLKSTTIDPTVDTTVKVRYPDAPAKVTGTLWQMPGKFSDDYDPETKSGSWPGYKTGKDHQIWLSDAVMKLVGDGPATGPVFPGQSGSGLSPKVLEKTMRRIIKKLGIPRATPHDLRRSNGTQITTMGLGRDAMNRWQGHADGGVGDVYDQCEYLPESWMVAEAIAERIANLLK